MVLKIACVGFQLGVLFELYSEFTIKNLLEKNLSQLIFIQIIIIHSILGKGKEVKPSQIQSITVAVSAKTVTFSVRKTVPTLVFRNHKSNVSFVVRLQVLVHSGQARALVHASEVTVGFYQ